MWSRTNSYNININSSSHKTAKNRDIGFLYSYIYTWCCIHRLSPVNSCPRMLVATPAVFFLLNYDKRRSSVAGRNAGQLGGHLLAISSKGSTNTGGILPLLMCRLFLRMLEVVFTQQMKKKACFFLSTYLQLYVAAANCGTP